MLSNNANNGHLQNFGRIMKKAQVVWFLLSVVFLGIAGARDLLAGDLLVGSQTNSPGSRSILRYNGTTGAFISAFVPSGSGGLNAPRGMTFGPDGNLYVLNSDPTDNFNILRYDGTTGDFMDVFVSGGVDGDNLIL